jgi:hypothetical protein
MGFVRSDVGDLIAPQKNDHGPSYRHYRASQRRGSPKFTICEIFGVVSIFDFFDSIGQKRKSRGLNKAPANSGRRLICSAKPAR